MQNLDSQAVPADVPDQQLRAKLRGLIDSIQGVGELQEVPVKRWGILAMFPMHAGHGDRAVCEACIPKHPEDFGGKGIEVTSIYPGDCDLECWYCAQPICD